MHGGVFKKFNLIHGRVVPKFNFMHGGSKKKVPFDPHTIISGIALSIALHNADIEIKHKLKFIIDDIVLQGRSTFKSLTKIYKVG